MSWDSHKVFAKEFPGLVEEILENAGTPEWKGHIRVPQIGALILRGLAEVSLFEPVVPSTALASIREVLREAIRRTREDPERREARLAFLTPVERALQAAEGFVALTRPTKADLDQATQTPPPKRNAPRETA